MAPIYIQFIPPFGFLDFWSTGRFNWLNRVEAGPGRPYCIEYDASKDSSAVESIFTGWKFSASLKLSPPSLITDSYT